MTGDDSPLSHPLPSVFHDLAEKLEAKPWVFATEGEEAIAAKSLEAAKALFDMSITLESISHTRLHPFLESILEPSPITLRSKASAKEPTLDETSKIAISPQTILPYTPLSSLTVDGLDPEQVWAQLELRAESIVKAAAQIRESPGEMIEDLSSSGSEEDISLEDFTQMLRDAGHPVDDMDDDEILAMKEEMGIGGEDDSDDEDLSLDDFRGMLMEAGYDGVHEMDDDELLDLKNDMDGESEDDASEDDGSDEDAEISFKEFSDEELDDDEDGGSDTDEEDEDEEDEEEDGDEEMAAFDDNDEDSEDDDSNSLLTSQPTSNHKSKARHPTLDDDFFSIDDFNRMTEEAEAGRLTTGRLGGDGEDEDFEEDLGGVWLEGAGDDEEASYADFFAPPKSTKSSSKPVKSAILKGKKPKRNVQFDEDDLMGDDDGGEIDGDEARGVMGRVKGDLFDDESEAEEEEKVLSSHERRQRELAVQIAELEDQAVGPKEWTLLGEASSRARPENSLLEEDLDFEQVGKVVPVITEDTVRTMEELIKQRILDNNFDSPVRVRAYEPTAFLPSRFFDLQDTQSSKSLAQIYEEEYTAAASGEKIKDVRDEKLKKAHDEIEGLWGEICYKLDALSSLNFVPKAPKAAITTISDLPTTSLESALPTTSSTSTMLAPQELFAAPSSSTLVARSELTSEEAQKLRGKNRKHKKAERKKLEDMADLHGKKKRKTAREEKEEALKGLVKSGKGVTIVGKGGKEDSKGRKRDAAGDGEQDGKRLKL